VAQAGAHLKHSYWPVSRYLDEFRRRKTALLKQAPEMPGYDLNAATTFNLSFERVQGQSQEAVALLRLIAFLAPEDIPLEAIEANAGRLSPPLNGIKDNPDLFSKAVAALKDASLLEARPGEDAVDARQRLDVHRLVQLAVRDGMSEEERGKWAANAVGVVADAFPESPRNVDEARLGDRLIPHMLEAARAMMELRVLTRELPRAFGMAAQHFIMRGLLADAGRNSKMAVAVRGALAKADPSNAEWQRDLSVSHSKTGDVLRAQGDLKGALAAYRASHGIAERLAECDPSNAGWQRDLAVSHERTGDVLSAQGDLKGALAAFKAGMEIRERLAKGDPSTTGWQTDLIVSRMKLYFLMDVSQPEAKKAARDILVANLEVLRPLAAEGRLTAEQSGWLKDHEERLAALEKGEGAC
jgi:tetratricopeptide (TPR) repeat protein